MNNTLKDLCILMTEINNFIAPGNVKQAVRALIKAIAV